MAVGLKERSGADPMSRAPGLIAQRAGAHGDEDFWRAGFAVAGIRFAEGHDSGNLGQGGAPCFSPISDGGSTGLTGAADLDQQLSVVGVGEEFDFAHSRGNFAGASALPQRRYATIDQRRTDGTGFDGEEFVGGQFEISGG